LSATRISSSLVEQAGQYELPVAQYLRLRAHIPALYGLLSVNAAALAYTHRALAPSLLTLKLPAILIVVSLIRMFAWMRPIDPASLDVETATRVMNRTVVLSAFLSAAYLGWALWLDRYGGPYEHGHVAIFIAVTVLGCVFCLNALPLAANVASTIVIGAFLAYCFIAGTEVQIAIAINIALVTSVLLKLLKDSFDAFVCLERVQRELVGERRQAQTLGEQNALLARTDALTGLPNRRHFFAVLDKLLNDPPADLAFCVGLFDLDRFKPVNDTHGHVQGDRLLQEIATRVSMACPEGTVVARLGGDEFGLICRGDQSEAELLAVAICEAVSLPVQLGDTLVSVGCSAGLAGYPAAGTTAHSLFDRADFALYHAKRHGRGKCVHFSEELERLIRCEQALDTALQSADLIRELAVVYQPIYNTDTMCVHGVECLARWHSPKLGMVGPEQLFVTAERIGSARTVTLTLFERALEAVRELPADLTVTFNLSAHDLSDPGTIAALLRKIETADLDARRLMFEITETSLIADLDMARSALYQLRKAGSRIALDDFGTGYSSLSSLHQLPLDVVKIDRSFAARLDDPGGRQLINAIRGMARSLSLDCVIEGIETESQLLAARLSGFRLAQGYFLDRPMELARILDKLSLPKIKVPSAA